jgi:hypothetical protein
LPLGIPRDELTDVCSAGHADEAALLIDVIDEVGWEFQGDAASTFRAGMGRHEVMRVVSGF